GRRLRGCRHILEIHYGCRFVHPGEHLARADLAGHPALSGARGVSASRRDADAPVGRFVLPGRPGAPLAPSPGAVLAQCRYLYAHLRWRRPGRLRFGLWACTKGTHCCESDGLADLSREYSLFFQHTERYALAAAGNRPAVRGRETDAIRVFRGTDRPYT